MPSDTQLTLYIDFVPERVKAEDALAKRKQSEAGTS
jgi:hypothetical protein